MRRLLEDLGLAQLNPRQLRGPPRPKLKIDAPSMKNGRFSWKNVSASLRFTTAGSTSTWPKSGFTVALRVRLGPSPMRASAPMPGVSFDPSLNGFPGVRDDSSALPVV